MSDVSSKHLEASASIGLSVFLFFLMPKHTPGFINAALIHFWPLGGSKKKKVQPPHIPGCGAGQVAYSK